MDVFLDFLDDACLDRLYDAARYAVYSELCLTNEGELITSNSQYYGRNNNPHKSSFDNWNYLAHFDVCNLSLWERNSQYRQTLSLFLSLWIISTVAYLTFGTFCYYYMFDFNLKKHPKYRSSQVRSEMTQSLTTLFLLNLFTAPIFVAQIQGYGHLYSFGSGEVPLWYEFAQFPLAVLFIDGGIYCLHRIMHHPVLFRRLHRQHHWYIIPTPFSAYAFHPLEAWVLSVPVYLYSFIFPMSKLAQISILIYSNMATFLDHDGGFQWHTVHHRGFDRNYGQLVTFWDRLFWTYESPENYAKRMLGKKSRVVRT